MEREKPEETIERKASRGLHNNILNFVVVAVFLFLGSSSFPFSTDPLHHPPLPTCRMAKQKKQRVERLKLREKENRYDWGWMTSSAGWHQQDFLRCKFIPKESQFDSEMGNEWMLLHNSWLLLASSRGKKVSILDFPKEFSLIGKLLRVIFYLLSD